MFDGHRSFIINAEKRGPIHQHFLKRYELFTRRNKEKRMLNHFSTEIQTKTLTFQTMLKIKSKVELPE